MGTEIRIFIGFQQTKEIKLHLKQSERWKEAKITGESHLLETQYLNREYLGTFLGMSATSAELKKVEEEVRSQLQLYCPKLNLDKQHAYMLSQLFIL